jgi:hypothetical protein
MSNNNRTYTPDRWELVKITKGTHSYYRVLAGWAGGFTTGASWKLSSGVNEIEKDDEAYHFHNASGSVYSCRFNSRGLTGLTASVLSNFQAELAADDTTIEVVDPDEATL